MTTLKLGHPANQDFPGIDDQTLQPAPPTITAGLMSVATYVWDTVGLQWVKGTQAGGGSGGSVTVTNFPSVQPVTLPTLAIQYDQTTYPVCYLGKAVAGSSLSASVWAIQQLTFASSGGVSILWAGGSTGNTNVWNNRTSLSYS